MATLEQVVRHEQHRIVVNFAADLGVFVHWSLGNAVVFGNFPAAKARELGQALLAAADAAEAAASAEVPA